MAIRTKGDDVSWITLYEKFGFTLWNVKITNKITAVCSFVLQAIFQFGSHVKLGGFLTISFEFWIWISIFSHICTQDIYFLYIKKFANAKANCFVYVPVISKTLEHIETFNTNCKVVS